MKAIRINKYLLTAALVAFFAPLLTVDAHYSASSSLAAPQTDPSTSLSRGRALLKQGHADQALPMLESALNSFTQTNNARGIAAAEDALGDLYMIQGQHRVALDHYRSAYQSFVVASGKDQTGASAANSVASRAGSTASAATETAASTLDNGFNANLMLAKIGDTNYRLGQMSEASTAYFQMTVKKPESAGAKVTRRFRAAARTSLGDVALREGRFKDAAKVFSDAAEGAKKDERLDLMWPAQRGLGRSLWLQAAQEKDGTKMRDQALNAYREALKTIETIRAGSLRADESRTTFLATTEDVYDEASSAFAEMAVSVPGAVATGSGGLSGKSLDYAAE